MHKEDVGVECERHYIRPFWLVFTGGSPTLFGLGRGPITPLGPAMVRMDRKDLNSNKQTKNERHFFATCHGNTV